MNLRRKPRPKSNDEQYQEYLGDVITKNSSRDYKASVGRDIMRRPNVNHPKFGEHSERRRQLNQLDRADKRGGALNRLLENY